MRIIFFIAIVLLAGCKKPESTSPVLKTKGNYSAPGCTNLSQGKSFRAYFNNDLDPYNGSSPIGEVKLPFTDTSSFGAYNSTDGNYSIYNHTYTASGDDTVNIKLKVYLQNSGTHFKLWINKNNKPITEGWFWYAEKNFNGLKEITLNNYPIKAGDKISAYFSSMSQSIIYSKVDSSYSYFSVEACQ